MDVVILKCKTNSYMKSDLVFCFAARARLNPYGKGDDTEAIKVYTNFYYDEKNEWDKVEKPF